MSAGIPEIETRARRAGTRGARRLKSRRTGHTQKVGFVPRATSGTRGDRRLKARRSGQTQKVGFVPRAPSGTRGARRLKTRRAGPTLRGWDSCRAPSGTRGARRLKTRRAGPRFRGWDSCRERQRNARRATPEDQTAGRGGKTSATLARRVWRRRVGFEPCQPL